MGYCQPWLDNFIPAVPFHHLPHMWIYTEQADPCPSGTTDFSYDWKGVTGLDLPTGGPLTIPDEIAPNLNLDAWQKSAGCNLGGLGFISFGNVMVSQIVRLSSLKVGSRNAMFSQNWVTSFAPARNRLVAR